MIIDLEAERKRRDDELNGPDPDCVVRDHDGVEMYRFAVDFRHDDRVFTFHIFAYSEEDAEDRVNSIRGNAEVFGQIVAMGAL